MQLQPSHYILRDPELKFRPGCTSLTEVIPGKDGRWDAKMLRGSAHLTETLSDWRQWGFADLEADYDKVSLRNPYLSDVMLIFYILSASGAGCQLRSKSL
jgi:hypothetical protein